MSKVYSSIAELVGNTPLLELNGYEKKYNVNAHVLAKLEYLNPNGSSKDRPALNMILEAEKSGELKPGDTIVETTSGNTGIGIAGIAASRGYKFRIYMQDTASEERFKVIRAFGGVTEKLGENPYSSKALRESGGDIVAAINALRENVFSRDDHLFFTDQMANKANPEAHFKTTGPEIWNDTDGNVDIFIAGVGTGGTFSGTAKYLRSMKNDIQLIAVQPGPGSIPSEEHPVLEREIAGVHPFEGVPADRVPVNMDTSLYDECFRVEAAEAYEAARDVARTDGILVGPSSGAAIYAARKVAERPENRGKNIAIILPDTGLRYLSAGLFE